MAFSFWQTVQAQARTFPGYVASISEERRDRSVEVSVETNPPVAQRDLIPFIFAPGLEKEFRDKYEATFGRTPLEQEIFTYNHFTSVEYSSGLRVSVEEDLRLQKAYGEFVLKRLAEYHVDQYFKSEPTLRPVYELKERISHYDVEVKKGYKFKIEYKFSENAIEARLTNPYDVRTLVKTQFSTNAVGPGSIKDTELGLGKDLSVRWKLDGYYRTQTQVIGLVAVRTFNPHTSAYTQLKRSFKNDGLTAESESLFLVGLSFTN